MATVPILYIPPSSGDASASLGNFTVGSSLFVTSNALIRGNLTVNGTFNGGGGGSFVTTTTLDNNTLPASFTSLSVSGAGTIDHLTVGGSLGLTVTNTGTFNGNVVATGGTLTAASNNSVVLGGSVSAPAFIQGYNGTGHHGPLQLNPAGDVVNVVGTLSVNTTTLTGGNAVAIQLPTTAGTLALLPASGSYVTTVTLDNATLPASFTTLNTAGVMVMTLPGTGNTNFINAFEASQATSTAVAMSFGQSNATNLGGTLNFVFNGSSATNTVNLGLINGSQLSITGAGIFSTPHVTIDDGSGNMTTPGFLNLSSTSASGGPTLTTRAPSTKVVLAPYVSGTQVDYAIGVDNGGDGQFYRWDSVPNNGTNFRWYASTNLIMTLQGTGELNSLHNTLDDGTGKMIVASNLTFNGTLTPGSTSTTGGSTINSFGYVLFPTGASSTSNWGVITTGGTQVLTVVNSATAGQTSVSTQHVTIDNGSGAFSSASVSTTGQGTFGDQLNVVTGNPSTLKISVATSGNNMTFGLQANQQVVFLGGGSNVAIQGTNNTGTGNTALTLNPNGGTVITGAAFTSTGEVTANAGASTIALAVNSTLAAGSGYIQFLNPNVPSGSSYTTLFGLGTSSRVGNLNYNVTAAGASDSVSLSCFTGSSVSVDGVGNFTITSNTIKNSAANNLSLPAPGRNANLSYNNMYVASLATTSSPCPITQVVASSGFSSAAAAVNVPIGTFDVFICITGGVSANSNATVTITVGGGFTFNGASFCEFENIQASTATSTLTLFTNVTNTVAANAMQIQFTNLVTGGAGTLRMIQSIA